jgi:hypothetical protein
VYLGTNNLQLYQTDLNGGNVATFGNPLPSGGGEVVLGSSVGLGGFTSGDVFAGSGGNIYRYSNAGGAPSLFSTPGGGTIRSVLFDTTGGFGGKMLVSTSSGNIYSINSAGSAALLASVGEDTEGMDIATTNWGPYAGQILVSSEGSGRLRFISQTGVITNVDSAPGVHITVPSAESISFVPLNLGASGNPLEGYYVANYPADIQKAGASQFATLIGHAIVTSEDPANSRVWDLTYNGGTGFFSLNTTPVGHLSGQSEDGIFVTADRINLTSVPEPSSLYLLAGVLATLAYRFRRSPAA